VVSLNAYDWHRRRKLEKSVELDLRKKRLLKTPKTINLNSVDTPDQLPWYDLSVQEFNEKYAYEPYELVGKFDHSKEVLVHKVRDGNFN